ncbi:MAG: hypothetical protein JW772_02415 [Candidatus Diapherotrites archaeon]|nr:hypothetical protein [Candidatus Diapherotrites archaeon]
MPKRRRKKRERTFPLENQGRRPKTQIIDLLALGEGAEPSTAHRAAQALHKRGKTGRIVMVDYQKPRYETGPNLVHIQSGVISYLKNVKPGTVRRVTDDYFYQNSGWKETGGWVKDLKKVVGVAKAMQHYSLTGEATKKLAVKDPKKMRRAYVRLVKTALAPGGRFILTTERGVLADEIFSTLTAEGFKVTQRRMARREVKKKGSPQAKADLRKFKVVIRIVGVKPK